MPDTRLQKLSNAKEAIEAHCYEDAVDILQGLARTRPKDAVVAYNLGLALYLAGRWGDSLDAYSRALAISPDNPAILASYALAASLVGSTRDSVRAAERAVALVPNNTGFRVNLTSVYMNVGKLRDAVAQADKILDRGANTSAAFNKGLSELWLGNYIEGFAGFEYRPGGPARDPAAGPYWDGSPTDDELCLFAEQGFGDAIQFARFIAAARKRCGRVVVACKKPIAMLMSRIDGVDEVVTDPHPQNYCQKRGRSLSLLSLPHVLGTTRETLPRGVYVNPPDDLVRQWRRRLAIDRRTRTIGIAWSGSPTNRLDQLRTVPVASFRRISKLPRVRLLSLQKEVAESDQSIARELGIESAVDADFDDVAAILKSVDAVVTIDSALAHVAGACGAKTLVALSNRGEWRYGVDRVDNDWYPSMTVFRQTQIGAWETTFKAIAEHLATR